jgi:copper(I)-binding protein
MLKLQSWIRLGIAAVLPAALGVLAGQAVAQTAVSIDGAWCLTSQYNRHTAFVYMTLTVEDEASDALTGAVSSIADEIQILAPDPSGNRKKLEPVSTVPLDPHEPTVLEPTETHLLLKGLNRKLVPGDEFDLKLNFAHAGTQDAVVKVLRYPPSAGMPDLPKGVKVE